MFKSFLLVPVLFVANLVGPAHAAAAKVDIVPELCGTQLDSSGDTMVCLAKSAKTQDSVLILQRVGQAQKYYIPAVTSQVSQDNLSDKNSTVEIWIAKGVGPYRDKEGSPVYGQYELEYSLKGGKKIGFVKFNSLSTMGLDPFEFETVK